MAQPKQVSMLTLTHSLLFKDSTLHLEITQLEKDLTSSSHIRTKVSL